MTISGKIGFSRKSGKGLGTAVLVSVAVHVVLAAVAGVWVVSHYIQKKPPQFTAPPPPKIRVPPQTRQHRMNLAAHAGLASRPVFKKRLVSLRPTAFSLPEMPKVSVETMLAPDPSTLAAGMVTGLIGSGAGMGAGHGFGLGGAGGKGHGTGLNFMGIQANGQKVLLLFDVSRSVVNKAEKSGMPLSRIKEETHRLIDRLPMDARFGIIQFVRNYQPFRPELLPATVPNRELARQWIEKEWKETGQLPRNGKGVIAPSPNGLPAILTVAYAMRPDAIFLISDGSFERGSGTNEKIRSEEFDAFFRSALSDGIRIPIHFIGFQMKREDAAFWSQWVRRMGGEFREIQ
ncbi:MAG: hypothetical protein QM627_04535 [Luteolibacter sp.]